MMEDGELGHGQDKTEETDNQEPEDAFDGHHDARDQDGRHEQVNQYCQKHIHQGAIYPKTRDKQARKAADFYI